MIAYNEAFVCSHTNKAVWELVMAFVRVWF